MARRRDGPVSPSKEHGTWRVEADKPSRDARASWDARRIEARQIQRGRTIFCGWCGGPTPAMGSCESFLAPPMNRDPPPAGLRCCRPNPHGANRPISTRSRAAAGPANAPSGPARSDGWPTLAASAGPQLGGTASRRDGVHRGSLGQPPALHHRGRCRPRTRPGPIRGTGQSTVRRGCSGLLRPNAPDRRDPASWQPPPASLFIDRRSCVGPRSHGSGTRGRHRPARTTGRAGRHAADRRSIAAACSTTAPISQTTAPTAPTARV